MNSNRPSVSRGPATVVLCDKNDSLSVPDSRATVNPGQRSLRTPTEDARRIGPLGASRSWQMDPWELPPPIPFRHIWGARVLFQSWGRPIRHWGGRVTLSRLGSASFVNKSSPASPRGFCPTVCIEVESGSTDPSNHRPRKIPPSLRSAVTMKGEHT